MDLWRLPLAAQGLRVQGLRVQGLAVHARAKGVTTLWYDFCG